MSFIADFGSVWRRCNSSSLPTIIVCLTGFVGGLWAWPIAGKALQNVGVTFYQPTSQPEWYSLYDPKQQLLVLTAAGAGGVATGVATGLAIKTAIVLPMTICARRRRNNQMSV